MDEAYQNFMLGKVSNSPSVITNEDTKFTSKRNSNNYNNRKRRSKPILKAFQGRLVEWKATNQQLDNVVRSIVNIRDRIHWESSRLEQMQPYPLLHDSKKNRSWRDFGFRSSSSFHHHHQGNNSSDGGDYCSSSSSLHREDICLALNHDLLQLERMLSLLRSLLATLGNNVDEIGRRLDEWMSLNLLSSESAPSPSPPSSPTNNYSNVDSTQKTAWTNEQNILEDAQELYSLLAIDLFRKQKLAIDILDLQAQKNPRNCASRTWQQGIENKDTITHNLVNKVLGIAP